MEKRLRCKDCKWCVRRTGYGYAFCNHLRVREVNLGWLACKKFESKDKVTD